MSADVSLLWGSSLYHRPASALSELRFLVEKRHLPSRVCLTLGNPVEESGTHSLEIVSTDPISLREEVESKGSLQASFQNSKYLSQVYLLSPEATRRSSRSCTLLRH